jgi:hypothetical protein
LRFEAHQASRLGLKINNEGEEPVTVTVNVRKRASASLGKARVRQLGFILAALAFVVACMAATASADEPTATQAEPLPASALDGAGGQNALASLTNAQAAEELPHSDLDRTEALTLMEKVFGPVLQSPAGPFDDLHVERFLSNNVAVIAPGDQPAASGVAVGGAATDAEYEGPTLMESSVPLRTGGTAPSDALDLGLERDSDELQPANPLAEVSIPQELGERIELPETGIEVELAGAPSEVSPSIIQQSVAAYPSVAQDTSFAVAPTPTGFETMTVLQSADAPTTQTFHLDLPSGANLEETFDGGAIVTRNGQTLLEISPASAIDAAGEDVPVELAVSGDSISVKASPRSSSAYPIMVDPKFQYAWGEKSETNFEDWTSAGNTSGLTLGTKAVCVLTCTPGMAGKSGLDVFTKEGQSTPANSEVDWSLYVPRYFSDISNYGTPPQSFVQSMILQELGFWSPKEKSVYPALSTGLWDEIGQKYTSQLIHTGAESNLGNMSTTYSFNYGGDENAKRAIAAYVYSTEAHTMKQQNREIYVGSATIYLGDSGAPSFGTPTPSIEGWVNTQATPISFTASDAGLGMKSMAVWLEGTEEKKALTTSLSCLSTPASPCPRTWKSSEAGTPAVKYEPATLPQGEDWLKLKASDAAENATTTKVKVKVDHTPPSIALSGSMTEQATIGTSRPRYVLTTSNTDGTEAAPQSGVVSTEITIDGKKVDSTSAGCAAGKNCSVNRGWALESSAYSVGKHVVVAKATDGVGLTTEKTLNIEIQKDTTNPTIENFGSLYNAPDGWVEQKTYEFGINAWDKGYGVTSLEFKMDGAVVKSAKTACPNGGCTEWLNVSINMASYKGGAHTAAIVATDGAGNVTTETWTVNVNPKGEVSAAEAINTLKAVDATGGTQVVTPSSELVESAEAEEGNMPGLKQTGTELVSTGTGAETLMTTNPSGIVTIESAEGSIKVDPTTSIKSTSSEVTGGSSVAVAGGASVDTIARPIYDGLMTYQEIRDATAPQNYTWEVSLNAGQSLKAVDSKHVAIFNEDGTQALAIAAEPSHDATGKEVPTELSVSGKVLTLIVKHVGGGFVYPIVGGPAFHSSYVEPVIYTPPPPPPPEEGMTKAEAEAIINSEAVYLNISAPQYAGCPETGEACASSSAPYRTYAAPACSSLPLVGCSVWEEKIKGFYYYNYLQAWKSKREPKCSHQASPTFAVSEDYCSWVGPDHQPYGKQPDGSNGYHITSQVRFNVSALQVQTTSQKYLTIRMYGDGNAYVTSSPNICNPSKPSCA